MRHAFGTADDVYTPKSQERGFRAGEGDVQNVRSVMEDAARWRELEGERRQQARADFEAQKGGLETQIADLESQLARAKRDLEDALASEESRVASDADLDAATSARRREGVTELMSLQCAELTKRAEQGVSAEVERRLAFEDWLSEQGLAEQLASYRQFEDTVRPTLDKMPESYQKVVLGHHEQVVSTLQEAVEPYWAEPASVEADPLALDLVFAVDELDGQPDLLVVVTPVIAETYADWQTREPDAHTWVFTRVLQAMHEALESAGVPNSQVMAGPHEGVIALEADVVGASPDLNEKVEQALSRVMSEAPELGALHLTFDIHQLGADDLLPPEEDNGGE